MDIYLVAVYKEQPKDCANPWIYRLRTWGWYQKLADYSDSNDPVVVRMEKPKYAEGIFNFTL